MMVFVWAERESWLESSLVCCGKDAPLLLRLWTHQLCSKRSALPPIHVAPAPRCSEEIYGRGTCHASSRRPVERNLVRSLHWDNLHVLWPRAFTNQRLHPEWIHPCHMGLFTKHTDREERHALIKEDAADRAMIRETLLTCIDILDTSKHPETGLINVFFSGRVIDDSTVNVHEAVEIGAAEQLAFEGAMDGLPVSISSSQRKWKNMAAVMKVTTKHAKVDTAIDTEFIYAHVLGIMVTSGIRFCWDLVFPWTSSIAYSSFWWEWWHKDN